MNWFLILAAIISLLGMFFHGVAGQTKYIGNIYKSEMEPLTKSLSLVSWHVFTIFLFISAITLSYIAYNPSKAMAVYPIIGVNLLGSLLFIFLGLGNHRTLLKMPGAYLMAATALLACLGI
jgi:glucan phosphoethanolaminetransferase (alkaline phosphatase superfamily)